MIYSDDEVRRALDRFENDPSPANFPCTAEQLDDLTPEQRWHYDATMKRITNRLMREEHDAWWSGPAGQPVPPGGVWCWLSDPDDELRELTDRDPGPPPAA